MVVTSYVFFAHLTIVVCKNTSIIVFDKEKLHISLSDVQNIRFLVNKIRNIEHNFSVLYALFAYNL